MALNLFKSGIDSGSAMQAHHFTQSIDALTGAVAYNITVSGSVTLTGSVQVDGLTTTPNTNVATYNKNTGLITTTASIDLLVGRTDSASYFDLRDGTNVTTNRIGSAHYINMAGDTITDVRFNNFSASHNTGSFTSSFTGSLTGTASYVDIQAGSGITINKVGTAYYISGSNLSGNTDSLTTTDFNNFLNTYKTGSLTGSFTGSLFGTASHVNLVAGTNVTIAKVGSAFEITQLNAAPTLSNILNTASLVTSESIQFTKSDSSTFIIPITQSGIIAISKSFYENFGDTGSVSIPTQLPGGSVRMYVLPANATFYLPTESINIGDTIDIIFVNPSYIIV